MKLVYTLEMHDLVALNQYFLNHSDFVKSRCRKVITLVCVIYGLLGLLHAVVNQSPSPLIIWALLALLYCAYYYRSCRKASPKTVSKLYAPDKNKGVLCEHELEILEDGLLDRTPIGEYKTTFAGIEQIVQTDTHGFIFIGTLSAHVIPRARIPDAEFETFMRTASERWQSQRGR